MADAHRVRDEHADGRLRPVRAARRGGDHDEGPLPVARVTLYTAEGCRLCQRALEVVREVQQEIGFDLELVDIGSDAELEKRYREHLPVVEIDGERVFTYFVDRDGLKALLG